MQGTERPLGYISDFSKQQYDANCAAGKLSRNHQSLMPHEINQRARTPRVWLTQASKTCQFPRSRAALPYYVGRRQGDLFSSFEARYIQPSLVFHTLYPRPPSKREIFVFTKIPGHKRTEKSPPASLPLLQLGGLIAKPRSPVLISSDTRLSIPYI